MCVLFDGMFYCALQTADLASANATEEDKVMAMISQSGEGYEPSQ